VVIHFSHNSVAVEAPTDQAGRVAMAGLTAAIGEVLEAAVPIAHVDGGGKLAAFGLVCEIFEEGHATERFPHQGEIVCPLA
jgi:hypothetical protein